MKKKKITHKYENSKYITGEITTLIECIERFYSKND